jgi:hypothetical protein
VRGRRVKGGDEGEGRELIGFMYTHEIQR